MSQIYKNAYVTLSAAKAKSCEEGFLEPRATAAQLLKLSFETKILAPKDSVALEEWIKANRLNDDASNLKFVLDVEDRFKASAWNRAEEWCGAPSTIWIAVTPLGVEGHDDLLTAWDVRKEPVSKRGWTLQESWLSPRMLVYGSTQMLWKCRANVQADGGVLGSAFDRDMRDVYRTDREGRIVHHDGTEVPESEWGRICHEMWADLVGELSRRALTVAGDKLNALEGIVPELRRPTGDQYLAGLWRSNLVNELCWYQDSRNADSDSLLWNMDRTCPSWSWAKTDGPVAFSPAENSRAVVVDAVISRNEMVGEYPNSRLVVEGTITLRAPIASATSSLLSHFTFPEPASLPKPFINVILPDGGFSNPEIRMQATAAGRPQIEIPPDLRFLELTRGRQGGSQNIVSESRGLALAPVDVEGRQNVYVRLAFYTVALEEEVEPSNLAYTTATEQVNVRETEFGKLWKGSLKEEEAIII